MWIFWVSGSLFVASVAATVILWAKGQMLIDYDWGVAPLVLMILCPLILAIAGFMTAYNQKRVDRINADFGTSYTRNEFFWQGDYIESKLVGDKIRMELLDD